MRLVCADSHVSPYVQVASALRAPLACEHPLLSRLLWFCQVGIHAKAGQNNRLAGPDYAPFASDTDGPHTMLDSIACPTPTPTPTPMATPKLNKSTSNFEDDCSSDSTSDQVSKLVSFVAETTGGHLPLNSKTTAVSATGNCVLDFPRACMALLGCILTCHLLDNCTAEVCVGVGWGGGGGGGFGGFVH